MCKKQTIHTFFAISLESLRNFNQIKIKLKMQHRHTGILYYKIVVSFPTQYALH